jgi:hypothetical protein
MSGQALVYFGISGGTLLLALSLLRKRFVERDALAVSSRGGYTMFAILMLLFSAGAFLAGYFSRS